jgi:hypothetical protein
MTESLSKSGGSPARPGLLGVAGLLLFGLPSGGLGFGLGALGLAGGLIVVRWEWNGRRAHPAPIVERA